MSNHTASLVSQISRGTSFYAAFLGNTDLLGKGDVLVSWGSHPFFSEYGSKGKLLLDGTWPSPDQSYRAYRRALDRVTALPAGRRGPQEARQLDRVRELERRDAGRRLAGPGRPQRQPPEDGGTALADRL